MLCNFAKKKLLNRIFQDFYKFFRTVIWKNIYFIRMKQIMFHSDKNMEKKTHSQHFEGTKKAPWNESK